MKASAPAPAERSRGAAVQLAGRVVAGWLGTLAVVNVVGAWRHPGFDENVWWIDLRGLPSDLDHVVLLLAGMSMIAWAIAPGRRVWRRATSVAFAGLGLAAVFDVARYARLVGDGQIVPARRVPLSLFVVALLAGLWWLARRPPARMGRRPALAVVALTTAGFFVAAPLAQIAFFGTTDYRRPADVAIVFGARVMPDGLPSVALADRVRTGVELYREGLVGTVIMTGGVEADTGSDETLVMAMMAEDLGVPEGAIIRDAQGASTDASVRSTATILAAHGFSRVLAVSHFYHLPRIKLAYARAGIDVDTVPARITAHIPQAAANAAREIPALWAYYLRAMLT
jgi:vancomycin permeability regulator SanA